MPAPRIHRAPEPPPPVSFNEVYARELRAIRPKVFAATQGTGTTTGPEDDAVRIADGEARARNLAATFARVGTELRGDASRWDPDEAPLAALCLSGGGIRSATFNLGMLQGLARARLLQQFDYLSSVSGGGFVAGWLKAWMHRDGTDRVIEQLRSVPAAAGVDPLHPEPTPLDQLRHYSNYLTPRVGLFSPDTWTVAALVLRNLLLNWLVIVPLLAAVVSIPQAAMVIAVARDMFRPENVQIAGTAVAVLSVVLGLVASYNVHRFRRASLEMRRAGTTEPGNLGVPERTVAAWAVLPLFLSASLLAAAALARPWAPACCVPGPDGTATALFAALWTIGIPLVGWVFHRPSQRAWAEFVSLLISGALAGVILVALANWGEDYLAERLSLYAVISLPLLLANYLLARALFVGLSGDRSGPRPASKKTRETWPGADAARASLDRSDHDREWWARFSGWVLALAIAWIGFSMIALLALDILQQVWNRYLPGILAALGGVSGIATAILGRSGDTPSGRAAAVDAGSRAKEWALRLAAPTFIALLLITIAQGNLVLAAEIAPRLPERPEIRVLILPGLFVLFVAFASAVGAFVNVNRFSMHGLYRNRLVRAYLGASNKARRQDPFTGFSQGDNVYLRDLWRPAQSDSDRPGSTRPLPVINASLNLVTGEKLAWQHRKAESFSMTPFYCGNFHEGYRRTSEYGGPFGVSLGTAMAISGAAANPNMGYHSSAAVTFLMALFNARLGSWLGNTNEHGASTFHLPGPRWAVRPLFAELLGMTTATSRYVNLSDGGHFDNLGLYEMVLRRCRYIVVSDAGRDPTHAFEDLGNAIRKIRIDFGIPIEFERRIEIPPRTASSSGLFCAVATIRYSVIDASPEAADGWLVYVKPALNARAARKKADAPVPYDVFSYAQRSKDFPHETTNDQWFDEAQFESYRALGFHVISQLTDAIRGDTTPSLPELRESVLDYMGEAVASAAARAVAPAGAMPAGVPGPPAAVS